MTWSSSELSFRKRLRFAWLMLTGKFFITLSLEAVYSDEGTQPRGEA